MENNPKSTAEIAPPLFAIEPDAARSMAEEKGLALPDLLPTLVPKARSLCHAPISNFPVGAVGLGASGRIYFGTNVEFPGLPLHHSVHAEQFLVTVVSLHEDRITHIAVSSVPCGHCRQFLQELRSSSKIEILVPGTIANFTPLSSLLPHPFGPPDLLHHAVPLLLEPQHNDLTLLDTEDPNNLTSCNGFALEDQLREAAMEGARRAHAPYSRCPAGFAVGDEEGRVFQGSYAESSAYNPSLGPVQAAMISYVAGGDKEFGRIVAAALVEGEGALVSQEATARVLLRSVAPKCKLQVYHCRVGS